MGFVPNMRVPAYVIVNDELEELLLEELKNGSKSSAGGAGGGGFLPALKQVANVAALPGIVKGSYAMPDVHSGYGFCIGNVAAFDMNDEESVVSPGGVGFDINCGVRLIRTNLTEADVMGQLREDLCQALFDHIPVGVGQNGVIPLNGNKDMDDVLLMGMTFPPVFKTSPQIKQTAICFQSGIKDASSAYRSVYDVGITKTRGRVLPSE